MIRNTTKLDTAWLRDLVDALRPAGVAASSFDIRYNNSRRRGGHTGRAYAQGSSYHSRAVPFITIKLDPNACYPFRVVPPPGRGYLPFDLFDLGEAAVALTAHELRHLWQAKHPDARRARGSRGVFSERDADVAAIQALRRYRRGELACGRARVQPEPTEAERAAARAEAAAKRRAKREAHVRDQVATWKRRLRTAERRLKAWQQQLRRLEARARAEAREAEAALITDAERAERAAQRARSDAQAARAAAHMEKANESKE